MAGDWIKMRLELQTHPKVVRILSATQSDKFRVIGGLHAVWGVFDTHSEDGTLDGYTPDSLDQVIGWPGFSEAMIEAKWLVDNNGESLTLPEFGEHNGQSAKRRAEDTKRKRKSRKDEDVARTDCGQTADKLRNREDKREDKDQKTLPAGPTIPHAEVLSLYHKILHNNPRVKVWTDKRKRLLKARWLDDPKRQSLEYWEKFFHHVAASPFLTGRVERRDQPPFIADLEWLLNEGNFTKVIERKYHERVVE